MSLLYLDEVTKAYPAQPLPAVDRLSLELEKGEILALLGPSGCGKTTTLRLIAGFERPDAGVVKIGGKIMANERICVPPEQRGVGVVFQEYYALSASDGRRKRHVWPTPSQCEGTGTAPARDVGYGGARPAGQALST